MINSKTLLTVVLLFVVVLLAFTQAATKQNIDTNDSK